MSCTLGYLQTGRCVADICQDALTHQLPGFRHYDSYSRRRGQAAARRKIVQDVDRARKFIRESPPGTDVTATLVDLEAIADEVEAHPQWFAGKAGTTDHCVLMNLIAIGKRARSLSFAVSTRQLAEAAGISAGASSASLRRLVAKGTFLLRLAPAKGPKPATYKLRFPRNARATAVEMGDGDGGEHDIRRSQGGLAEVHDAFTTPNLGLGAGRTHALLSAVPITVKALMRRLGRSRSSVHTYLDRLTGFGLARRTNNGYVAQSPPEDHDWQPVRERRASRFREQRAVFHTWLEQRRAAHLRGAANSALARRETAVATRNEWTEQTQPSSAAADASRSALRRRPKTAASR